MIQKPTQQTKEKILKTNSRRKLKIKTYLRIVIKKKIQKTKPRRKLKTLLNMCLNNIVMKFPF